ncbi:MAG: hypothetical protein DYG98_09710 [Haliscomenobacteraceae bacterium CHB4]|nr:hypothetical protein [Saprospiraceae bacterium]MCE7923323.1 hypothetical protein [Haliscomenobacteraceae bacterium CHB4]
MSFFNRLFGSDKNIQAPDIPFGRYTDAYKTDLQQRAFDRSLELFDEGRHLEAYEAFMSYLKDNQADNIEWRKKDDTLEFEFWQGSQHITGTATAEKVKAESRIARADDLNVGFLRRLMEANFNLKFSRFALAPDNILTILFDTHVTDGSPYKLLYALRELAIHADKQDDLLLDEFKTLSPVQERTYGDIPEAEKEVKYNFLHRKIEEVFAEMDKAKPDPNTYPGTFAYLLLSLAFKLDYLVRPEGFMMDTLERIHGIYFAKNDRTPQVKVTSIRKELHKLLDRPKEALFKEMYRTRSTFGINPAVNHDSIVSLIEGELPNMEWPLQQNYEALALAVPQYVAGFALFHYAPPKPDRELFHLFFQIMEPAFFSGLGFNVPYAGANGSLNRSEITKRIKNIAERNRSHFPYLRPQVERLDFASPVLFARSYLLMIKELNLTKDV